MAEEALKKQAAEMGIAIKVETNGARGIDHKLTAEDIQKADGIIVAADKKVEMNRFAGKPMVQVPVAAAIRQPEELISKAISGNAPKFEADAADEAKEESVGSKQD